MFEDEVPWKFGSDLHPEDKSHVLQAYLHRFTKDHKPTWAHELMPDGSPYPVQFASDLDWLENTKFAVTKSGRLDHRVHHCHSRATWPDNPELREKYR